MYLYSCSLLHCTSPLNYRQCFLKHYDAQLALDYMLITFIFCGISSNGKGSELARNQKQQSPSW